MLFHCFISRIAMLLKKTPKMIKDPSFEQPGNLNANDLERLACSSFNDVACKIHEYWQDGPILILGLKLAGNNESIIETKIIFQGRMFKNKPKQIKASNIWPFGDQLVLNLSQLDCGLFEFKTKLTSELMDSSKLNYSITRHGQKLDQEELNKLGFKGFSCRIYLMPVEARKAQVLFLLYPLPVEELLTNNPLAGQDQFPGIAVHWEKIELGFDCNTLFDKPIGGPILPAILPGVAIKVGEKIPPTMEIHARMASLLRQIIEPECKDNYTTWAVRCKEIKRHGEIQFKYKTPEFIWPEPGHQDLTIGEDIIFYIN